MRRLVAGLIVALSVALAAPAIAAAPLGESLSGEAKTDYESAKVLYDDGDFVGAGSKFQQAYDRSKDARLLWNVAVCEKAQRHYVRVRALVRRRDAGGDN